MLPDIPVTLVRLSVDNVKARFRKFTILRLCQARAVTSRVQVQLKRGSGASEGAIGQAELGVFGVYQ